MPRPEEEFQQKLMILPDFQLRSFYLISIKDAIRAHRATKAVSKCGDLAGPWKSSWIPLLESDFGYHIVLETEGKEEGILRVLWHETSERPIIVFQKISTTLCPIAMEAKFLCARKEESTH